MIGGKYGGRFPQYGRNGKVFLKFPVKELPHKTSFPPSDEKTPVKRQVTFIKITDFELLGFRTIDRQVEDRKIEKIDLSTVPDCKIKGLTRSATVSHGVPKIR